MIDANGVEQLRRSYRAFQIEPPARHVVLGSGYAHALTALSPRLAPDWELVGELPFSKVPGLQAATAPGHGAAYRYYRHRKLGHAVCLQLGRLHGYEGLPASAVARTVTLPCLAGTREFILTNSAGALARDLPVGGALLLTDHVNLTGQNPLAGPNSTDAGGKPCGPRFPDLTAAYDPELRRKLAARLKEGGIEVREGIYLGLLGPSFETPAEVALFGRWGLQAVGMSTVWEAIALRYLGARLAGISLLCNLGAGLSSVPLTAEEVLEVAARAGPGILTAIFAHLAEPVA